MEEKKISRIFKINHPKFHLKIYKKRKVNDSQTTEIGYRIQTNRKITEPHVDSLSRFFLNAPMKTKQKPL